MLFSIEKMSKCIHKWSRSVLFMFYTASRLFWNQGCLSFMGSKLLYWAKAISEIVQTSKEQFGELIWSLTSPGGLIPSRATDFSCSVPEKPFRLRLDELAATAGTAALKLDVVSNLDPPGSSAWCAKNSRIHIPRLLGVKTYLVLTWRKLFWISC